MLSPAIAASARCSAVIDLGDAAFHSGVNRLERVGGFQAGAQLAEDAKAMKGQRVVESFVQARGGGAVQKNQLSADLPQRARVAASYVGCS
jgi:hypothetical protein